MEITIDGFMSKEENNSAAFTVRIFCFGVETGSVPVALGLMPYYFVVFCELVACVRSLDHWRSCGDILLKCCADTP